MGYYLNNDACYTAFQYIAEMDYFVDKSEILNELIPVIDTEDRFVCIIRPRRFGKTAAANLIASFFSRGCDSRNVFEKLKIRSNPEFDKHLNKHNVITIDFSKMPFPCDDYNDYITSIVKKLLADLTADYPDCGITLEDAPWDALEMIRLKKHERFIFVLDEWDFIFHDGSFKEQDYKKFLRFLQNLLKSQAYVEMAYMTGILPIAKYSSGSPLNMFSEYTMANDMARYGTCFGFTEKEAELLYEKYVNSNQVRFSFQDLKEWYNGYQTSNGEAVFNPRSVNAAFTENHLGAYWSSSGPYDEIFYYINHNLHEVRDDVVRMVAGDWVDITVRNYSAEMMELNSREDIFSAMVVYGMLTYRKGKVAIPNKELMIKYEEVLQKKEMGYVAALARRSEEMLEATLSGDTVKMKSILSDAHDTEMPILNYNNESDLSALVNLIYLSARDRYNMEREDRAGRGYADFIFYPKNNCDPGLVLELKAGSSVEVALDQIKNKKYALRLAGRLTGGQKILAVALTYDKKSKEHYCAVEEIQ